MISPLLVDQILDHLGIETELTSLNALDKLMDAYVRRVPWESISRMAQRAKVAHISRCPRWPVQFWEQAMQQGTGGTCFESNYAFYQLLLTLGYRGYLTINNMQDSIGCHTAIIIEFLGKKYLVDAGLPLHVPIPLDPTKPTVRESDFHTFTVTPTKPNHYRVTRDRHPRPYCFDLIDVPIDDETYRTATTNDYDKEKGLFLDRMIVVKVIDGVIWRFGSHDGRPYHMESFVEDGKTYHHLGDDLVVAANKVAKKFGMDVQLAEFVAKKHRQ